MASNVISSLRTIFGNEELPKPFDLLELALNPTAKEPGGSRLSSTAKKLIAEIRTSSDPLQTALALPPKFSPDERLRQRVLMTLGQLLLGLVAERSFEAIYKRTLGTSELQLEDAREARSDTDYRVLNGKGRAVFRINIKFHGTLFRQAKEVVGLEPTDCFALATYKIKQGLDKQEKEVLPYVFVVVSCPVSALEVGGAIPREIVDLICFVHASKKVVGKRKIEERIVDYLAEGRVPSFAKTLADLAEKLSSAPWRVLSARRADNLLREKLFERVFAVRVRSFTRSYRNAEVDMHYRCPPI